MISIQQLLKTCVNENASDIHLVAGSAPILRISGKITPLKSKILSGDDTRTLCYSIISEDQRTHFEENKELDFSFSIRGVSRFRVNYFYQKGQVSGTFRRISLEIPQLHELNLPHIVKEVLTFPHGLVLVTGPTGSGKSTTVAAFVDCINRERQSHIITLEDPIEYVHSHKNCIINQREIHTDTESFKTGLKHIVRQDPDICILGELRDAESLDAALNLAETGHLVIATMHTNSSIHTLNRIVSLFPTGEYSKICSQLSQVLNAVLSQLLIPTVNNKLYPACEFLKLNAAIRALIRDGKIHQIKGMMEVGQEKSGMLVMNQSIANLILERRINIKIGFQNSPDPEGLDALLQKVGM